MRTETKVNGIVVGVLSGVIMGLFFAVKTWTRTGDWLVAGKAFLLGGVIFGLLFGVMCWFFVEKIAKRQTDAQKNTDGTFIHEGPANHFKGWEAVGGRLYLFPDKLEYHSHHLNIQNHSLILEKGSIRKVELYNVYGLIPTGLSVTDSEGKVQKFVVGDRKLWKRKIEETLLATPAE